MLVPGLSRRAARERITDGSVFVDGRRIRVQSRPLKGGERIEIRERPQERSHMGTSCPPFVEHEGVLVVNKPSGMPTEPTRQASAGSLTHAVREALQHKGERPADQPGRHFLAAAHRLDLETSGVVLLAMDPAVAAELGAQLASGQADRRYLALVDGRPDFSEARLDSAIAKERGKDGRYPLTPGGREAVTLVTVLARSDAAEKEGTSANGAALLAVQPLTGRTHQIRAHLAAAGHPVAGDVRYGGSASPPGAFGLHALAITVARGGVRSVYAAPPPAAFYDLATASGIEREAVKAAAGAHLDGALVPPPANPGE